MLTGLELAAWERAGYFVRRNMLPATSIRTLREIPTGLPADDIRGRLSDLLAGVPALVELLIDLMGPDLALLSAEMVSKPIEHGYARSSGPALDAPALTQASSLAGEARGLVLSAAATEAEWLDALPGTHTQPPDPEQLESLQGGAEIPGAVRIRLAEGDVLLRDTRLAHRCANPMGLWARCEFAASLPGARGATPPIERDATLPEALRLAFRHARRRIGR